MKMRYPYRGDPWVRQVQRLQTTQSRAERLAAAREDIGHALDDAHAENECRTRPWFRDVASRVRCRDIAFDHIRAAPGIEARQ